MVKNYYENNVLFDTTLNVHEDTKYDTEIIMKKKKLGYVENAKYLYRRHSNQATEIKNNPYFCFEDFMKLFEFCVKNYMKQDGHLYKYAQAIILNIYRWRIVQDNLLPYFYEEEQYNKAISRLKDIIKRIDNQIIIEDKLMDKYHKLYLINLKNDTNINIKKSYDGRIYSINDEKNILFSESNVEIVVNRFKMKEDNLYILGYLKSPILAFIKPELWLVCEENNDKVIKKEKIQVSDNTLSNRYKTNMEIAKFYKFEIDINVNKISNIQLQVNIDDKEIPVRYIFNQWAPFSGKLKNYKKYFGNYRVQFKKNVFYIRTPNKKTRNKDFKRTVKKYYNINKRIDIYRAIALLVRDNKKNIWLYYDRKNVFDNAYIQFKHDIKIKDNIKKYYILDGDIKDFKDKFSLKERRNVIKFGSYKHKLLFLNCDKILTSFSSLQEYCPFAKKFVYYKDILKYDLIYLQHGVLHAKLLKMYGKEFTPIDKFVISSQFEKDNLINNYGYSKKDLICVGMPRLDEKNEEVKADNKIIFAPSWRQYLIGKSVDRKREINEEKFKKSKYYIETMKFLKDERLLKTLEKNNIILDYKLHPIFEPYEKCFKEIENSNIAVSIGSADLNKYKAFITDFSSFQFDFVRLHRPIIYFVPDMQEFKAGLHTYKELDLKHEDAFGNLVLTGDKLVEEIIKIIDNDFEAEPIYKERMERFFFDVKNRKDRLYDILKEDLS